MTAATVPHRNGIADIDQPLSARSGSVRVARQAGTKQATNDATATTRNADPNAIGSRGLTLYNR
jgi:hypothetical protein